MKLSEQDRNRLARRVGGTPDDVALAANCVTVFCEAMRSTTATPGARQQQQQQQQLNYDVVTPYEDNDALFAVRFTQGVAMLTHAMIEAVQRQSTVRALTVDTDRDGNIVLVLLRSRVDGERAVSEHAARAAFTAPSSRKRRQVECDYAASGVESSDDRSNIDAVVDDVYHMRERLPVDMEHWFEHVRAGSGGAERRGHVLPLTRQMAGGGGADDDESESVVTGPVVGYSLCFTNVGAVNGAFLRHLHAKHPSVVLSSYVWVEPPHQVAAEPLLVVNVRAAAAVASDVRRRLAVVTPRGVKRARHSAKVK